MSYMIQDINNKNELWNILQCYEKKVYKQRWSTIPPMSTKRTITSHLKSLNLKKITTYHHGSPCPGMRQAQQYVGVNPINDHSVVDN